MATGITTYGDISPRTAALASMDALSVAENHYVLAKLGESRPQPKNRSDSVKFRRYLPFPISTVPLQEGVTPSPQLMSHEDVLIQLQQYGNYAELTDWIEDTHEDPVLKYATDRIGEQAAGTVEQVIYNAVKAGTNVLYANGSARNAVNTAITLNLLRKVARQLYAQKAKKISRILDASPAYGTSAIEASYVAVCHTDCIADIRSLNGFVPVADYGTRKTVSDHEFGAVEDFRFVASADLAPFMEAGGTKGLMKGGTNADVYPILFFGQEAFAIVPLKGENALTPLVHNAKVSASDPLAQRSTVGYKFATAAGILNELWMLRAEVAVNAL